MELKTARLTLLIDPAKKAAFERLCARQDVTPSQVVRRLIREYLATHKVSYVPSGASAQTDSDTSRRNVGRQASAGVARKPRAKGASGGSTR